MKRYAAILLAGLVLIWFGCRPQTDNSGQVADASAPTGFTREINRQAGAALALDDPTDFDEARKGLIASEPELVIKDKNGKVIWDPARYGFIQGAAPASVNPSLWRQAKLNDIHGLFKVAEGIYQVRGYDLANLTLIEGHTGWIVIDPLTSEETAARAFQFACRHLGKKPVSALIYTHCHVDHFGGVTGILTPEVAQGDKVPIIAPQGFMAEAVSENVMAGIVMERRSLYMYGNRLPYADRGHVGSGLGKAPARGTIGILPPTETISQPISHKTVDGIRFIFQSVPGSEAPAEMTFYLPDKKAFCGAEIVSHTMHNLYTLRGAKVRDALQWSNYIDQALGQFGKAEIYFGTHHWPIWGNARIVDFLKKQRDLYKYIHDQTMRLAYQGLTPDEIAESLELPPSLGSEFYNRGYYGSLRHNAKAVYQYYFGWFDGNPAHLNPLPPETSAKKYIEYMGGMESVLAKAQQSFDQGDYRWVAEVMNRAVFAEPDNDPAKALLARAYEQLGYQSESGPWRDVYLSGALELRHGGPKHPTDMASAMQLLEKTPMPLLLDAMAARLNGPKAEGKHLKINIQFTDLGENYVLTLENAVMHYKQADPDTDANATVKLTAKFYLQMAIGETGIKELFTSDDIHYEGSKLDLIRFFNLFDKPTGIFNIVTP